MLAQRGHETGALDNFSGLQCHRIVVLQIAMVPRSIVLNVGPDFSGIAIRNMSLIQHRM